MDRTTDSQSCDTPKSPPLVGLRKKGQIRQFLPQPDFEPLMGGSLILFDEIHEPMFQTCFQQTQPCRIVTRLGHDRRTLIHTLSIGAANMAAARTTMAAKEGIDAFLEKRDPKWD